MADTREVRLRRWATRLGLVLQKSRARLPAIHDHGLYQLRSADTNAVIAGPKFDLDLDGVEQVLADRERELIDGRRPLAGGRP